MSMAIWIPLLLFVICFLIRIPISLGMIATAVAYFILTGKEMGLLVDNVMYSLYSSYVLIAVPLFVFTANVMNNGAISDKVFTFANALVGRYRGGLGHVNVINSLIFSGMTGSAVADAAGLGKMEIEHMKKHGYSGGFSCAITAASATVGPIFPPSIPMIIYCMLSGASIGAMFAGGVVPGLLICAALMLYIVYIAKKRNYPGGERFTLAEFLRYTIVAFPALLAPVILLGGIYGGVMTPTEAGAVAAFYALLISIFVYRVLGLKALGQLLKETVATVGNLGLLVGAAYSFSFIVASEQIPGMISNLILGITDNPYLFLLIINVLFLILGMFMDTSVIMLVFIPIVIPLVQIMEIDVVHFGVMIVLNMMIGLSTPPFGMLLFITSGVSRTPLKEVIRETMPMVYVMIVVLFLVTYIPDIVLFVPKLLGL
ncbi:MAG: TRAP transporter large permease [Bacillota bacterium]